MAEENADAIPGTESEDSTEDMKYSARLDFLDQLMLQNQPRKPSLMKNGTFKNGIGNWFHN